MTESTSLALYIERLQLPFDGLVLESTGEASRDNRLV